MNCLYRLPKFVGRLTGAASRTGKVMAVRASLAPEEFERLNAMSLGMSATAGASGCKRRGRAASTIGACFIALAWMALPAVSHATCTIKDHGVVQAGPVTIPLSVVGGGPLQIDPNAPVNTLLGKLAVYANGADTSINCTDSNPYMKMDGAGPVIGTVPGSVIGGRYTGNATLYQSQIPGIGYAVSWDGAGWAGWMPQQRNGPGWSLAPTSTSTLTVYLVKTNGTIPAGVNVLSGIFATWTMYPANATWINWGFDGDVPIEPISPTCVVSTSDIVVDLVAAEASEFPNVRDTAKEKDFKVSLACSGGNAGTKTEVSMSLADQTTPVNVSTDLSLTHAVIPAKAGIHRDDVSCAMEGEATKV
jgi:hypothetical protein